MTRSHYSVSATMSECSGTLQPPVSAEAGQMMIRRLMFAMSPSLCSARPVMGQVRLSIWRKTSNLSLSVAGSRVKFDDAE